MPAVAYSRCVVCYDPIPVAMTSDLVRAPGEPLTLVADATDVWAHAWTHGEQADAGQ